tara:strand:+ start:350 stop:715 length:366 start_codon:yes stop_codon:yes gene_type:complete
MSMSDIKTNTIERFLHGQIEAWNTGNKEAFFEHYRAISPNGLTIEYVGRPPLNVDGWAVLEGMWEHQNNKFSVDVELSVIAGQEAACHHRNVMRDGTGVIETIEHYRFVDGKSIVRYFIKS